jgi:hypothetical protein
MPELSRFFGIIVRMYMEAGIQHHVPHFHAYYQNEVAVYGINPIELISGNLPKRQQRMVEAWRNCIKVNCSKIGTDCRLDTRLNLSHL